MTGAIFGFCGFAACNYPDTIIQRPHHIFWRVMLGLYSLYAMFMIYMFFLPLDDARKLLKFFDSELGESLPERSYADDCRIYTPEHPDTPFFNLYDAVLDVHFVVCIAKHYLFRHTYLAGGSR